MIKRACDCTLTLFITCLFDGNISVLDSHPPVPKPAEYEKDLADAWETIYEEYVGISGAAKTKEFELIKALTNIQSRLSSIPAIVEVQRLFVLHFGVPHFPGLVQLKKFGYNIFWNTAAPDPELFEKKMSEVIAKEKRFVSERDARIKDLADLYRDGVKSKSDSKKERTEFMRLINHVGKFGFTVNKAVTTVEEFAIMVKDYNDYIIEQAKANAKNK